MSLIANLVTTMLTTGCSAEQVAAAVRVVEDHENEKSKAVRAKWAEKKRKQRLSPNVSGTSGDIEGHRGTLGDPSFSPSNGFPPTHIIDYNTPLSLTSPLSPKKTNQKSRSASSAEFDLFWNHYPKKVGRGAAEKAWQKAIAVSSVEEIVRVVQVYPWGDDKQFIPHPATWLNQKRWQDDFTTTKTVVTKPSMDNPAALRKYWATVARERPLTETERAEANEAHHRQMEIENGLEIRRSLQRLGQGGDGPDDRHP